MISPAPGGDAPSPTRLILRRALLIPLLLVVAVLGQLAVVNRMPLPGGGGVPDLVVLVVAALGVSAGPVTGLLAGFAGGLAIDVAPPGGHLAGEYALVYCLVGYACGRIRDLVQGSSAERSATASLTVMAAGVAAGEAGKAALGMMLSDPDMTGPALEHVLPAAVVYDLLLCPFALWLVSVSVGRPAVERAPEPYFPQAFRLVPAFRLASAGAAPGLRLTGSSPALVPPPVRSEPRLRLGSGRSSSLSRTSGAFSTANPAAATGGRPVKVNFASAGRGKQMTGSALRAAGVANFQRKSPGKGWLRPGRPAGTAARQPAAPGKGWARGDMRTVPVRAPARRSASPGKGWIRPARAASTRVLRAPAGGPGKGWLRPVKPVPPPRLASPGRGWLRPARAVPPPHRKSPGRGWLRTSKPPKPNWYTRSPSTRWLRRGRRRRLMLGGRR
jgi:rod shape-determining protein MreD